MSWKCEHNLDFGFCGKCTKGAPPKPVATVVFEAPFFEYRIVHPNGAVTMAGGLTLPELSSALVRHLVTP